MAEGPQIASSFLDFVDKYAPPKLRPPAFLAVAVALGIAWYCDRTQTTLGIAAALALLAFLLTLGGLAKVTRRKGRFKTTAADFVGRDTEVTEIAGDIEEHRLLFVTGQSGCGKSTLIEHGVAPAIGRSGRRIVLLCQYLGEDWENGPADAVANRLDGVLTQDERTKLGIHPQLSIDDLMQALRSCKGVIDREPVLVFDQFDDYQLLHSARFVRRSRVLSPEKLIAENSFWRGVAQLLKDRSVRCVFVTRDDARPRLSAVEFQSPEEFELEPLDRRFAEEYLAQVSDGVLEDPDATWPALRRRVLRDLEADGKILPIRLISVVAGLEELNALSLREYERAGNLIGLEARALATRIRRAASSVGLNYEQALSLLVLLVSGKKTVPRSLDELSGKLARAAGSGEQVTKLLERLSEEHVVRPVSAERGRDTLWKLYHDYLSEPVAEVQRRAEYWQFALEEALDRYQAAKGPVARFRALVPPLRQLRFWFEASRRRVRFGHATGYMQLSLLRMVLNAGMLVIALAVWAGAREADRRAGDAARALFEQYASAEEESAQRSRALWEFSSVPARVKGAFVGQTLRSETEAKLIAKDDAVVTAVAGRFSTLVQPRWLRDAIGGLCISGKPRSFDMAETCLRWMEAGATPSSYAEFVVAETRQRKGPALGALAFRLGELGSRIPPTTAGELAEKLVAEMRQREYSRELWAQARGLGALASRVPGAKAGDLAEKVVDEMLLPKRSEISGLAVALSALGSRVLEAKAGDLAEKVLDEMLLRKGREISGLAYALRALGSRGPEAKIVAEAEKLVAEMRQRKDPPELSALARGLEALGSRVPEAKIVAAAEKLVAEMRQRKDPRELSTLASGLGALGSRVPEARAGEAAEKLVAAMRQRKDPGELSELAMGLGALGSRVPEATAGEAAEKLVAEMRQQDGFYLHSLALALETLGSRVSEARAGALADELVAETQQRKDPDGRSALGLAALAARVSDAKASKLLPVVLDQLQTVPHWDCGAIAGLFRRQQTLLILDLMKWPACSTTAELIRRIGELENVPFEDEQHRIDQQRFQDWLKQWAAKNNYDLSAPPEPTLKGMRGT
jgi:energy-coupling factor transporter ATP-binding protein EcfA2